MVLICYRINIFLFLYVNFRDLIAWFIFSRSFVPPARDDESETQRKAHAKRVRETRRSTQGVTLEEIKSAEQLVKMKNANNNNENVSKHLKAGIFRVSRSCTNKFAFTEWFSKNSKKYPPKYPQSFHEINFFAIFNFAQTKPKNSNQTENSSELNERLSESSTTSSLPAVAVGSNEDSSSNEVAVNYTISSPLRKTLRASVEENDDEQKISATFTLAPPPKLSTNSISLLASRLEKSEPATNSVTATINVPLITNKNTMETSDKLKKTELPSQKPVAQPRSLFDIDNASSTRLADKLQQEAKKCEINDDSPSYEPLPPSPIHHTIFGERRSSWRSKCDYGSKVKWRNLHC